MVARSQDTPVIALNNGTELPTLGLGVFQSPPAETIGAVEAALEIGYRLIDTAASYGNSPKYLDDLMARASVVPAVNQVEVHPFFVQGELRRAHERLGIATQAWSPLGGVNVYRPKDPNAVKNPLTHPVVTALATKYGKTPAQVILRWHVERRVSAIPKSVKPARIAENFDVFDFALTPGEVASIDALDTNVRGGPNPDSIDTKKFTLTIPD